MHYHSFEHPITDRDELLTHLPPLLIVAGSLTTRLGNKHIFQPYGLTVHLYAMLNHLAHQEEGCGCKMVDLRGIMFNSAANVTQHVDTLEEKGLVRRRPSSEDRRVNLVEITPEGRDLLEQVDNHYLHRMQAFLGDYETGDMQRLVSMLAKFIGQAYEMVDGDPPASSGGKKG